MRQGRLFALMALALCLIVIASPSLACSSAPKTKTPIKVVMATYFGSWLNTYAVSNGLVTSDNVDVTVDLSPSFDDQMMAGNYPVGVMTATAFAIAADKGIVGFEAMGIYLANKGTDDAKGVNIVYTKAGSLLKSPSDLKGKKVGIPGLQSGAASLFLGMLKDEYGIDQSQMTLVDSPVSQLITLLAKGDLDAALLNGDPSVQTFYNSAFQVLWNVDLAFQQKYGTYAMSTFLVAQADYLKNNRDTVKAVYDLLKKSSDYGEAHLAELVAKYVELNGGNADSLQNAYLNHYSVTFDNLEGKIKDGATTIFGFVKDRGIISNLPDPALVFMKW